MKSYEASGRTVEDAISAGLSENGLSLGDVSVEILEEGSKGLFGLFGSRDAKVRLTLKEGESHSDTMDLFKDSLSGSPKPRPKSEPVKAQEPRSNQGESKPQREARAPRQPKKEQQQKPAQPKESQEPKAPRAQKPRERKPQREAQAQAPVSLHESRNLQVLENPEQDSAAFVAQEFLKELTRLMGLEITTTMALDDDGHVFATLNGDPQGILIGRRGETLDALQYLTSLRVNKGKDSYTRVTIDSEGYRQKREEALIRLANRMANRARKTGRRVSMDPMNPYERRIFHSALQATPGIATHSEGEEPNRHIVITPVKDSNPQEETEA